MKITGPIRQRSSNAIPEGSVISIPLEHGGFKRTVLVYAFPTFGYPGFTASADITTDKPQGKIVKPPEVKKPKEPATVDATIQVAGVVAVEETVARIRKKLTAVSKASVWKSGDPQVGITELRAELSAILKEAKSK